LIGASQAQAALITFDLTQFTDGADPTSITQDGVILTASDFNSDAGAAVDSDGLCIAGGTDPSTFCRNELPTETTSTLSNFNFSFDAPVQLINYTVGFVERGANTASLWSTTFSQGGNSSVETNWVDESTVNFTNQFSVAGNQPVNVSTDFGTQSGAGTLQIRSLTVETNVQVVPEPSTILGTGVVLGVAKLMKRKKSNAQ
jgi:hypothetical protein